jgi:hypothetical protein
VDAPSRSLIRMMPSDEAPRVAYTLTP